MSLRSTWLVRFHIEASCKSSLYRGITANNWSNVFRQRVAWSRSRGCSGIKKRLVFRSITVGSRTTPKHVINLTRSRMWRIVRGVKLRISNKNPFGNIIGTSNQCDLLALPRIIHGPRSLMYILGEGGVLPHMGYTGMCGTKLGIVFQPFLIINRVRF